MRTDASLRGKVTYTITIVASGAVTRVEVEDESLRSDLVRACTVAKIEAWRFSIEDDLDETSEVTFSVMFTG